MVLGISACNVKLIPSKTTAIIVLLFPIYTINTSLGVLCLHVTYNTLNCYYNKPKNYRTFLKGNYYSDIQSVE